MKVVNLFQRHLNYAGVTLSFFVAAKKLSCCLFLGMILVSCGGKNAQDDNIAEQIEKNQKLKDQFGKVEGIYSGSFSPMGDVSGRVIRAEIILYSETVTDGVDPNGMPKIRPVLRGQFRLPYEVGELDDQFLDVGLNPSTGEITLNQRSDLGSSETVSLGICPTGPKDKLFYISGRVVDRDLELEIRKSGMLWGRMLATPNTKQLGGIIYDQAERLRKAYEEVRGTYIGHFVGTKSGGSDTRNRDGIRSEFKFKLALNVVDEYRGSVRCPKLVGQYTRLDVGTYPGTDVPIGEIVVNVFYFSGSKKVLCKSNDATGGLAGSKDLTLFGGLNQGQIEGDMVWFGRSGRFNIQKSN